MGGKQAGKRRYLGMEQILGCSDPPIRAPVPPTTGTLIPPEKPIQGQLAQLQVFSTFQFLNITVIPKTYLEGRRHVDEWTFYRKHDLC